MPDFPRSQIISLVGDAPPYDLAESVGPDLRLGELFDADALRSLADLTLGYGTAAGDAALREEIARAHGVAADDVVLTTGGIHALHLVASLLCEEGEAVITSPVFPLARHVLEAAGAQVRTLPLSFDAGYQPDLDALAALLTPATRLVSLATPQNPSGVAIPLDTLRGIVALMKARSPDAWLLVDETYREACIGDAPAAASALELGPRVISTASLSKCHGASGLRIGWAITRDRVLRERLLNAKFNTVISCGRLDEAVALRVLRDRDRILGVRRELLAANLAHLQTWLDRESHRVDGLRPAAGALCCVRLSPSVFDDAAVARFHAALPSHGVRVGDGRWFGESAKVFRLGFGVLAPAEFQAALVQVSAALDAALRPDQ
ncbi:pyridoxal phosphate-dependent aminotransferase [Piscinibacter terrae]|uniref:Aminotransferase n=1 Tax=Piscinibacter terrae TaxID=2496871 RepID=A0A3N7HKE5_9BURK|nr:pyridoxal phosphate-dependent aminotransferase [Albitalea terrae]RQP22557.1 pyridoxal phosphate-dependent aminotransferase [Albitalea terrae]